MMKYCPNCHANVEGLIYHCDCCGALFEQKKHFFICGIYELPQCLGFASLTREMIDALQPENPKKYEEFIQEVVIQMICYPESILADGNIKNRLYYSSKKKQAKITIIVDYKDFISADTQKKSSLIANSLLKNLHLLQKRLQKNKLCIDDIISKANILLGKYINKSSDYPN